MDRVSISSRVTNTIHLLTIKTGYKEVLARVGPVLTQSTQPCTVCQGQGSFFSPKDKCKKCKGVKVTEEKKMLEIYIPRGAQ
jgi:DnaJ homolog subfamily A member 2